MSHPLTLQEGFGIAIGVSAVVAANFGQRKPVMTGIYKHVAAGIAGYFGGMQLERWNDNRLREKMLVLEDYVRLHPEDFPDEPPKTYGDILMKWIPRR